MGIFDWFLGHDEEDDNGEEGITFSDCDVYERQWTDEEEAAFLADDRIDGEESHQETLDGMGLGWQCICGYLNAEFEMFCGDCGRMLGDDSEPV